MQFAMEIGKPLPSFLTSGKVKKPTTRLSWPFYREQNVIVIKKLKIMGLRGPR